MEVVHDRTNRDLKPLICLPDPGLWVLIGFWAVCGIGLTVAIFFFPQRPMGRDEWWGTAGLMAAFFGLPTLWGALWMRLCRIVADARGLTFRGFHRPYFIAWSDVEDFELRLAADSKTGEPTAWLQSSGKWRRLSPILKPREALLETITRHAKSAKATSWQLAETREDGDWPKIFEYRDESGWKLVGLYLLMSFGLSANVWIDGLFKGFGPIFTSISQIWEFLPFWGRVGFALMPVLTCGSLPLIFLTRYPAIVMRRRYLGEQIKATREGISLFRNSRQTHFRWEDIESYHLEVLPGSFQPTRCVIQSGGQRIEFLTNISDIKALQKLIQTRASSATTTQWLHPHGEAADIFGGAASLYPGGIVGVGPKTHHYRTRFMRALILLGFVMLAPMIVTLFTGTRNGLPANKSDYEMLFFFGVCVGLPTLGALLAFRFSSLCCEETGLRGRSVCGERFLAWDEIHKVAFNGYYYIVADQKRAIRFGVVADCKGLLAEIERRTGVEQKRDGNAF